MLSLSFLRSDTIEWSGEQWKVNMAFDNILRLFAMFDDQEIDGTEKLLLACEMLIIDEQLQEKLTAQQAVELALYALKELLGVNLLDSEETSDDKPILFDFEEDAGRIYASFLAEYKIDLFEQQGKMKWNVFLSLLEGLGEETPFKQAVHYRGCEMPKRDKHNEDERRRIRKMKEHYALKSERVQRKLAEQAHRKAMNVFKDFMK